MAFRINRFLWKAELIEAGRCPTGAVYEVFNVVAANFAEATEKVKKELGTYHTKLEIASLVPVSQVHA